MRPMFVVVAVQASGVLGAGCSQGVILEHLNHSESVCQDIGFCTSQSSDEIAACVRQAAILRTEAAASGCASLFDGYYECADDHYECHGNVPIFRGCEARLSALRDCLARAEALNSCGALNATLAACSGAGADAGPADVPPVPCVGGSVCVARCYLDNVPDVCTPSPVQLTAAIQCAEICQF